MDERTSPTAQPGKDWASFLPCHSNSIAWFHHPARFFYNYPIKFSQESWCNFRWPADFQRPYCKNCSILPVCIAQHQKDQALPYTACSTTSCSGPCHFKTGLLQCSSSWTSIMHNQTFTDDSECSSTTGLLRTQKSPCHNSLYLSPCTGSQLQLALSSRHWCLHIEQPQVQHLPTSTPLWQSTSPPEVWDLRVSGASWCHHREAQNHSPEHFHSPFLAGGNNFPPSSGMLNPWLFSSNTWKLISSVITWIHLARICSEQCLGICITSTSCVCLPLYNVLLIVFLNCKSLWIKVSTKLINVNVNNSNW